MAHKIVLVVIKNSKREQIVLKFGEVLHFYEPQFLYLVGWHEIPAALSLKYVMI